MLIYHLHLIKLLHFSGSLLVWSLRKTKHFPFKMCFLNSGPRLPTPLLCQGMPVGISIHVGTSFDPGLVRNTSLLLTCWSVLEGSVLTEPRLNHLLLSSIITEILFCLFVLSSVLQQPFPCFPWENSPSASSAARHTGDSPVQNVYIWVTAQKALKHLQ